MFNKNVMPSLQTTLPNHVLIRTSATKALKKILKEEIPKHLKTVIEFRKKYGKHQMGVTTVNTMYGGMRGVWGSIYETSYVAPDKGIRFRNMDIPTVRKKLPKFEKGKEPIAEGMFWLMLTGKVPTKDQVTLLSRELADRGKLPKYVTKMLDNFPKSLHPMAQLSCAITALNKNSQLNKAYKKGKKKTKLWKYALEDGVDLIAKIGPIAAIIYTNTYKCGKGNRKLYRGLDWSANMSQMMGYMQCDFWEFMRLYLTIHCDHEGGNVSAHAMHLVGSALSDPFLSYAAGLNGLAGPLHGLANQEVLIWMKALVKKLGKNPSDDQVRDYANASLKSGRVIPGYGHAALRITDPRFTVLAEFSKTHLPDYYLYKIAATMFKVIPPILKKLGKVKCPYPNVDAHSGIPLQYFGMTEMQYYTVLFGVSRALGCMASTVWSRAMMLPIERHKTSPTDLLIKKVKDDIKKKNEAKCKKPKKESKCKKPKRESKCKSKNKKGPICKK